MGIKLANCVENTISWKIFGPTRETITGDWNKLPGDHEDFYSHQIVFDSSKEGQDGRCVWNVWERREIILGLVGNC